MVILMIQFVAFFGALGFGRLAGRLGTKNTILLSLVIWSACVIYAAVGMRTLRTSWAWSSASWSSGSWVSSSPW